MGTYSITEKKSHPAKFACMVSFNGKDAEYYEIDSLDPAQIDLELQSTADADDDKAKAKAEVEATVDAIQIKGGKIVV